MSDRIAVFNRGRIEQIGTPSDLYERPATRFVADFIGETNFLPARILSAAGGLLDLEVLGRRMGARRAADGPGSGEVVVAIRPERLRLASGPEGVPGRVEDFVYLGNARRIVVRLADGRDAVLHQAIEEAKGGLAVGDAVTLAWDPDRALVYPA